MPAGRRNTPTAIKRTAGTLRTSRTNAAEPVTQGVPVPPEHLSDKARQTWFMVLPLLQGMNVVGAPDAMALESLCEAYAEVIKLRAAVQEHGHSYPCKTEAGDTMLRPNPEVPMLRAAVAEYTRLLTEFGLTPAARSKVSASDDKPNDPADAYDRKRSA